MNEVARGLVHRAESPPCVGRDFSRAAPLPALGIVPGGSGSGLARELGDRLCFNVAGIGLDAHVAALVSTGIHHRGRLPYLLVMVEDRGVFENMVRISSLFLGRLHRQNGIKASRVRELTIRSREPMLFHADGEAVQGTDTLIARVHPGALRLRA